MALSAIILCIIVVASSTRVSLVPIGYDFKERVPEITNGFTGCPWNALHVMYANDFRYFFFYHSARSSRIIQKHARLDEIFLESM